ncbi:hypothetical protein BHM03_00036840 [Ensete ventricosum]|nr:hypothetical protein BHM03_00036840 [Ensete ventricosum]
MGEVLAEVFFLLLPHLEEGCDGWLWSCTREEVGLELPCELIERVNGGGCSESYGLTHWVRASDAWLRRSRGPDPTQGRNGADCRRSRSSEAVHSMAALLLSRTRRLLEAVGLAVG